MSSKSWTSRSKSGPETASSRGSHPGHGQARWGTGVCMSAARRTGAARAGPVMKAAASTAAPPNAAAQIQLIWPKLDWNRAGFV